MACELISLSKMILFAMTECDLQFLTLIAISFIKVVQKRSLFLTQGYKK